MRVFRSNRKVESRRFRENAFDSDILYVKTWNPDISLILEGAGGVPLGTSTFKMEVAQLRNAFEDGITEEDVEVYEGRDRIYDINSLLYDSDDYVNGLVESKSRLRESEEPYDLGYNQYCGEDSVCQNPYRKGTNDYYGYETGFMDAARDNYDSRF